MAKGLAGRQALDNSLLAAGCTRSGTTWLAESLNADKHYRVIFEPFSPIHNQAWQTGGPQRWYLPNDSDFPHKELMRRFLAGQISNPWVNRVKGRRWSSQKLIKEVRVNAMLGWIQANFPELKIILIVRDPYSVAYSCTKRGWNENILNEYLEQPGFADDNLTKQQIKQLKKADSLFEKSIAVWAIETQLPLKNLRRDHMVTSVFYEHLARQTSQELKRLTAFCGRNLAADPTDTSRQSITSDQASVTDAKSWDFGQSWLGRITKKEEAYAETLLDSFGLTSLYPARNQPGYKQPLDLVL